MGVSIEIAIYSNKYRSRLPRFRSTSRLGPVLNVNSTLNEWTIF